MTAVPRLSVLVVAHNEARLLPDCLASAGFADELVVVLDRTTDASAAIAVAAGARVVEGAWPIEGPRRNDGIAACTGDWILELDADERVSPELAAEIRRVIAASRFAWHRVTVANHVGARLIRHGWAGGMGTTSKPALFRKGAKRWRDQRVHPGLDWTGEQGPPIETGALVHLLDDDISDMIRRLDRYSSAKAADLIASGDIGRLRTNLRRFVTRALKSYWRRKGHREGGWGVLIALAEGLMPLLAHLKARLEPERHGGRAPEQG